MILAGSSVSRPWFVFEANYTSAYSIQQECTASNCWSGGSAPCTRRPYRHLPQVFNSSVTRPARRNRQRFRAEKRSGHLDLEETFEERLSQDEGSSFFGYPAAARLL